MADIIEKCVTCIAYAACKNRFQFSIDKLQLDVDGNVAGAVNIQTIIIDVRNTLNCEILFYRTTYDIYKTFALKSGNKYYGKV